MTEADIFHAGITRAADDIYCDPQTGYYRANLLTASLDAFTPRLEGTNAREFCSPLRQLIALCMVLGRRLDTMNASLIQLRQQSSAESAQAIAAHREGTQEIVDAMKELKLTMTSVMARSG
jgi:hypothetical protein